ncbi:ribosome small subunit-dependent GTPase A [Microbulbifer sp. OS29]|uniref:Small ribosomal subunit biogenesis GTPase RsgA n=1 Tax=Microbulbifer okhotskensis TaxID=2926617 RepID=A0A9X2EJW3_9GAMM|nr:ribosome small subunit-dependent GTPase A [Microbulbifer okhotskensis]MCO1333589.1 ribosome small subunit-dependent GTPase A [Microbulbifer okhotskensis]
MSKSHFFRRFASGHGSKSAGNSGEHEASPLQKLGWKSFFQQQLSLDELEKYAPLRVTEVHRSRLVLAGEEGSTSLSLTASVASNMPTVGDWLLVARDSGHFVRLLNRSSQFERMAAGGQQVQLIAANVDSVFIVSSLNDDFNLSRIERYLALARESGCRPHLILSKADLCEDHSHYLQMLHPFGEMPVAVVNSLDGESVMQLRDWCLPGETIVLLGSSGVGKSTLLNTLSGESLAETGDTREADSKGRHTTRKRSLHPLSWGALLLDSPGMRELGLVHVEDGLVQTFADIEALARECRFSDCQHQSEPGCTVQNAIAEGVMDQRRLQNWQKLQTELCRNGRNLAQKRAGDRALSQLYRSVQNQSRRRKYHEKD